MQFGQLKRREFITLIGGVAAWPTHARAQQPAMPVVGFLHVAFPDRYKEQLAAFRQGLKQSGYIEGQDVQIEYRWASGDAERFRVLAAELVATRPDVLVAHTTLSAEAFARATRTIPIIFAAVSDPVGSGLVDALATVNDGTALSTAASAVVAPLEPVSVAATVVTRAAASAVFATVAFSGAIS